MNGSPEHVVASFPPQLLLATRALKMLVEALPGSESHQIRSNCKQIFNCVTTNAFIVT